MLVSSRGSLMAMLWTSSAVAASSPLIAEPILSRDLEVRQDTSEACPSSYESLNGLNFTTYCDQNNPFNDALDPFNSPSMQDCMEHCSRYWGNGEGCYGVVWVKGSGDCWLRNSTTSTANLRPLKGNHAALIQNGDMNGYDEDCPNTDLSINSLPGVEGIQYTTHCKKAVSGYDLCFSDYPHPCWESPYSGFYHTDTLEDCLKICVDQHPLCRAVTWNPGLEIGFANCWPKTGFPETLSAPGAKMGTLHSATITQIDPVDQDCPSAKNYAAQGKKNFQIHCGQLNTGTNITSIHTQNVTACMDACATSDAKCTGVLFDSSLAGGYKNCYLQNTTSVITSQAGVTYAVLGDASSSNNSTSGSDSSDSSSGSKSKAWIAGPVIGALAAIGIIAFAIFWWRRRKAQRTADGAEKGLAADHLQGGAGGGVHAGYGPAPAYSPAKHHNAPAPYHDAPVGEMDATPTTELPASTKYAHHTADGPSDSKAVRHELA